uniref:Single stranded DNA binding protein 2a n=1 Tax=Oncorhynchus kisutch TaxID=8019 RepID=A0A8C7MSK1_ONCKI
MYAKGKSNNVPSDSQAREKLALYVYEYLLHVGAQKSAQTFLSEIRWEKNITLGEPPGFLHSWWCVFWDLYCAAPERRETCEHSSEAKAFHDYSAAAAPSPILGNLPPGEGMPVGPVPPGFFQSFMSPRYPGGPRPPLRIPNQAMGVPGNQPMLPSGMDPTRQQGHPNMGGPMQRMTPPRGMVSLGPQVCDRLNEISRYSKHNFKLLVTFELVCRWVNIFVYMCLYVHFPMGPGADGPMGGMAGMEPHHMNGSLGSGDMDSLPKNSPGNLSLSNQPGTPREDGEMGGNFLNPFQNESVMT